MCGQHSNPCFDIGDTEIGVRLAVAAAPVFLSMSLLTECHRWSERALLALDGGVGHERDAMHLLAASGVSLMFTRGGNDAARVARNGASRSPKNTAGRLISFRYSVRFRCFTYALENSKPH